MLNSQPKKKAVRLKGKAYSAFRKEVYERENGVCQECETYAPLFDVYGQFNEFTCGHVSHIKSRGSGGSDTLDNVKWKCFKCHNIKEHGPKWSKKAVLEGVLKV